MGYTADLGLEQPDHTVAVMKAVEAPLGGFMNPYGGGGGGGASALLPHMQHTLQDRRALAGCYLITSSNATSVPSMTSVPFTVQLREACRLLEKSGKRSNDYRLAKMVMLQELIPARVAEAQKSRDTGLGRRKDVVPIIEDFRTDLGEFWGGLTDEVAEDSKCQDKDRQFFFFFDL